MKLKALKQLALSGLSLLMILTIMLGHFAGTAFGASGHYALAKDVVGAVYVKKAGGSKEIRVYQGMTFHEGDRIRVEGGASLTLNVAGREDEITLGEHWNGTLSKLRVSEAGDMETAIHTWSGSIFNSVQTLDREGSSYQVETPTSDMNVRGTNFTVFIDPITGISNVAVLSGRVAVTPPSRAPGSPITPDLGGIVLYPAQQVEQMASSLPGYTPVDLGLYMSSVPSKVVEEILASLSKIQEENRQMLESITEGAQNPSDVGNGTDFDPDLERFRDNLDRMIQGIINNAQDLGKVSQQQIEDILRNSSSLSDFEVYRPVPPIDPSVGLDSDRVAERQRQLDEVKARQQEKAAAQESLREQQIAQQQQILEQIKQKQEEINRRNQEAQEQKAKEAQEKYLATLSEQQRASLEQRVQQAEQQKRQQEERVSRQTPTPPVSPPVTPAPSAPAGPGSGGAPGQGPSVPPPLATSTTMDVDTHEIYAGQSFVVSAHAVITSTNMPVPDGTNIVFQDRSSKQVLATATTMNGEASAVITPEQSFTLNVGARQIEAVTAATSRTQSNTSFPVAITVMQDETTLEISAPHRVALVGETIPFTVQVSPKHGQVPAVGTVTLYEGDRELEVKELNADGSVVFHVLIEEPISDFTHKYTAVFEGTEKQAGSEGVKVIEVSSFHELPGYAYFFIEQVSPTQFNAVIALDRFTGDSEFYRAELEFEYGRGLKPLIGDNVRYYNPHKFDPVTVTESVYIHEGIYYQDVDFMEYIFEASQGAAFHAEDRFVIIPFTIVDPSASTILNIFRLSFFKQNGYGIEVMLTNEEDELNP